jgi:hypothetical protein
MTIRPATVSAGGAPEMASPDWVLDALARARNRHIADRGAMTGRHIA